MIFPWYIPAAGAAIITSMIAYGAHSLDVNRIEAKAAKELKDQVTFDINKCESSTKSTRDDNEHYQKAIASRDALITELSKRPAKCLYISRATNNTKSGSVQSGQGNGLPDSVLHRFSGFCEADRAGLETLQQHNDKVRCELK